MFLGDWLYRRALLTPGKVALVDAIRGGWKITYRQWNQAASRSAQLLRTLGVGKGDRVAILAYNGVEFLDLWFACGKLGAILQTLNWRLTTRELGELIHDAAPRVLVYGPEFLEQARSLREAGAAGLAGLALDANARAFPEDRSHDERDGLGDAALPPVELDWDDPWVLCYTGGTTGLPKGAILTHGNITWNAINTMVSWGLTPDDVTVLNAPLFHTGGLNVFTAPLVHIGGTSILCRSFDPDQVFDLIRDAGVTILFGVPTMFQALQQHPRWSSADFSRLKLVISGGAPCPAPVYERFWERGIAFKSGYGLTEAGPNTFWLPDADVRRKPGSVGFPLFHVDVKIVDGQGRAVGADEVGELLIRGPHVCAGYWNRPEETAETIRDGWLHTGDLARCDPEGYYFIVGRLKDVIISGGENIYPAEVESVLAAHPAVAEVALIGVPDVKWGETPRAVVAPRPGADRDRRASRLRGPAAGSIQASQKRHRGRDPAADRRRQNRQGTPEESAWRPMTGHYVESGNLRLHYLDHPGGEPALVFLPGLSATAPIFDDVIGAGLSPRFRALSLDLRGRGRSGAAPAGFDLAAPAANYTMADHAADVICLLDTLGLSQPILVGHSFGGMLAFFLAARHPERFPRLVVLDAATALVSPATREQLRPMIDRLGIRVPSWDAYVAAVKALPYLQDAWNPSLERYFRTYVDISHDGSVQQRVEPKAILAAVEAILIEDWRAILGRISQPVLLINARDPYGPPGAPPLLPQAQAMETVRALSNGRYAEVSGNHITMVFGNHARQVAALIDAFVTGEYA